MIGPDCDGNPVKAGDLVRVVRADPEPEMMGMVCTVIGPHPESDRIYGNTPNVLLNIPSPDGIDVTGPTRCLKIISDEQGSWDEIEKSTGWKPKIEEVA